MKKILISITMLLGVVFTNTSCSDYLDIVPEGTPTIDHAFLNRVSTEKFLGTCYSYLPNVSDPSSAPGFLAGDEFWLYAKGTGNLASHFGFNCWDIARGAQNTNQPLMNYWDGAGGAGSLWIAIRDCNIFLENVHKPADLDGFERDRWISEAKFLKAYYHFYLLQLYGPIPIVDVNIDVNEDIDAVRQYREPVDSVVSYITRLLDESLEFLPEKITDPKLDLGRISKPIALAVKAQVLTFAASPLMNGNPDYVELTDNRGVKLFSQEVDANKWTLAAAAALAAIEAAHVGGHRLFDFGRDIPSHKVISGMTLTTLSINGAATSLWNDEIIWGCTRSGGTSELQKRAMPKLAKANSGHLTVASLAPTLKTVEQFYTSNGVPMNEDKSAFWTENSGDKKYDLTTIMDEGDNKFVLMVGETTAKSHINREPRFYANLFFDRGLYYNEAVENDTTDSRQLRFRNGEASGQASSENYSITGYLPKKLINSETTLSNDGEGTFSAKRYAFPIIRLADLYLMYAEAVNESKSAPDAEVYKYIDIVRERAGLKGVEESWSTYSITPSNATSKVGMRKIIRDERLNELAYEGKRFWDLRRWKVVLDQEVYGLNIKGKTAEEFYQVTEVYKRPRYFFRDFLWPLRIDALQKNPNLVQNPGW